MSKMVKCSRCDGSGKIITDRYDANGEYCGEDEEICSYCNGTGERKAEDEWWENRGSKYNPFGNW